MPGTDRDLVRPLQKRIEKRYARIMIKTRVAKLEAHSEGLRATFEGPDVPAPQDFDRVLVAVGRSANGNAVNAAAAGVAVDKRGIIAVDKQMRTNVPHIFAIGDIVGAPMLAHKATHEAQGGGGSGRGTQVLVRCALHSLRRLHGSRDRLGGGHRDRGEGARYRIRQGHVSLGGERPIACLNRDDGFTKLLFDKETHRVIGGGIVGTNAGELIAEVGLAIEMGADAADIGLTIHAHPTLSETVAFAAEGVRGDVDGSLYSQALSRIA